uniref:Reverse transcriptase domain-containing protein n=1 Tax=Schistocephalus solidus TaxID=70667 RepID=A0A183SMX7_SCHSO
LADELATKVRVYCFILTMPTSKEVKAVHVKATWASRFDKFVFISSEDDPSFPMLKAVDSESRKHLWLKTRFGVINAYRNHLNDFDFFMKADDDTYVIVENLRLLLSTKDPDVPILMGRRFNVTISDAAIDWLPQVDTNHYLDLPPSPSETIRAVQQISSGKAPGSDAIPLEVYKHGRPRLRAELTTLFQEMWRQGQVPQDFKDTTVVHLYKWKGNRQLCDNHRGISLLNTARKIFARILLNRLNGHLEQGLLPKSQLTTEVKQGCVLAPTLFSLMFSAIFMDGYREEQPEIRIAYRTDGNLLNRRCMQVSTCMSTTTVQDLLFAEDCALNTVTEEDMQRSMDLFSAGCANFGLTISTAKTVLMAQPPPSAEYNTPQINVNGAQIKNVETFAYLGSTLSRNTRIDDEVAQWISNASQAFGRLRASVWKRHGVQLNTKLKMYKVVVLKTPLYGADPFTVYSNQVKKLNHFHLSCLRLILKLRWQERIPDTEVVERTGIISIHAMLKQIYVPQGYTSGGAGYVLSRAGLKAIAEGMLRNETGCEPALESEDYRLGKCAVAFKHLARKKASTCKGNFK